MFLIYLTDNTLFKIIIATIYLIMCANVYVYKYAYVWLCINEMNDSSNTRDRRKILWIVSYYKVFTLPVKWYVIWKWIWTGCNCILQTLGQLPKIVGKKVQLIC